MHIGRVNINTASVKELSSLPGMKAGTARAAVAYREEHGDFAAPEDIVLVSGIGPKTYAKLAPFICAEPSH